MALPRLGIIGIGRMGAPMSRRLMEAGYSLTVTDRNADAVAKLVAAGAASAPTPAAVTEAADVVLLSLPTPDIVDAVAFGADGIGTVAGAGKTVVDLSTTGPEGAKALAAGLSAEGFTVVDCPVSGGVGGAEKGTLALMASGDAAAYEALMPMFEVLGKPFLVGPDPGMGQMTKVMNNLLSVAALAVTSEALVLGQKAGLDPKVLVDVINVSSGQSNASMTKIPKFVLTRSFDFGFAIGLSNKDIRLCLESANALGVPMVVGSSVLELLKIANAKLGGDADLTQIIQPIEEWAGVTVGGED
ncbi:NAD(P)-dependent oxidoreductase [Acuticoccus sp. I52.16.1]|uniref:NAD(P)-dependent oxidoreductase n=1 Tax=Acuticoccus sp. I52.16.1 TaxID=2928472 RepID=UPI001FD54BD3|nr:NAD(P)-dependent oxidoreductase [Acuticoccus sp. I52.16.1]UOM35005.1 NAD(P)-dependent oxidoreductase [Acuticoccus sp. I52.16.1]